MKVGERVKVREDEFIAEPLRGKPGVVTEAIEHSDHYGPYTMLEVELDEVAVTTGIDGRIEHKNICMPASCFEEE